MALSKQPNKHRGETDSGTKCAAILRQGSCKLPPERLGVSEDAIEGRPWSS
jgi:hypothetical protein